MTRLAILDELLPAQLRERPSELNPVEVVWTGTSLDELVRAAAKTQPTVLALDFNLLGGEGRAAQATQRLMEATGAELAIVMHGFAKRQALEDVARPGVRTIRAPISLGALKVQMTSVIVRGMLEGRESTVQARPPAREPSAPAAARETGIKASYDPTAVVAPRRFSRTQLARLREIQSTVECECPNHLSELLLALGGFEDYSARCENKNAADAQVHAHLYRSTAEARRVMEEALSVLIAHEGITL